MCRPNAGIPPVACAVRRGSDPSAQLIGFHSSQCGDFHQLRVCCVSAASQLRQSGALRSRYAALLFLPDAAAQPRQFRTKHI